MSDNRDIRNIALVGFMGTGKTTVARLLAEQLHYTVLDTDELIEARAGKPITDIFAQDGEDRFRELERQVVDQLADGNRTVIATGGGLSTHGDNLARLKAHALTVCLWASPEKIWERIRHQTHRPLLDTPEPMEKIRDLLERREPCYRQADVLVNTDLRTVREVAQQVAHQYHLARSGTH